MAMDTHPCVLRSKEGRILMLRKYHGGPMLCAVSRQDAQNAPQVDVLKNDKNQLAFRFEESDGFYFPKVVGEVLTCEKNDTPTCLSESYWFEKYDICSGEHYGLRSVVEPRQYLYIKAERQRKVVSIRSTNQDCLQITDESKQIGGGGFSSSYSSESLDWVPEAVSTVNVDPLAATQASIFLLLLLLLLFILLLTFIMAPDRGDMWSYLLFF